MKDIIDIIDRIHERDIKILELIEKQIKLINKITDRVNNLEKEIELLKRKTDKSL